MSEVKREFLFRGKTPGPNGKWVYGSLITAENYCCILEKEEDVHPCDYPFLDGDMGWIDGKATPVIPETVGQYIGECDKNGTKVFDGDILDFFGPESDPLAMDYGVVVFKNGRFMVEYSRAWSTPNPRIIANETSIIGNIFDNPDLMIEPEF